MVNYARWIWVKDHYGKNITARFRKAFYLSERPVFCTLTVSAHHYFKLKVNGVEVGGLVSPASSVFESTKWVVRYDINDLLQAGENVLAFTVLYLGGKGQNRTKGSPGLLFELEGRMTDGSVFFIYSDEECRCSKVTRYIPGLPMREMRDLTGSTRVDLSREEVGWELPGFCDSAWDKSIISPAEFLVKELRLQEIPEGAISRSWVPECIHKGDNFWLFDAGEVLAGFVRVKFRARPGVLLRLRYGELLEGQRKTWEDFREEHPIKAMRVERSVVNNPSEFYIDEYIAQGGEELWEEDFSYRAFRYFELTGEAELISVEVCKAGTDAPCVGEFSCSNQLSNQLAEACINTQKNAILGVLVDCPHREQAQYIGDSLMQSHLLVYNFPHARVLLRKVLRDFADNQQAEGYFPFNSPLDWDPQSMHFLRMPEYDLLYPVLLRNLWFYYDDIDSVREFYPVSAKMTAYYLSLRDETGLMPKDQDPCMHISDWPYPTIDEDSEYLFVFQAYLLQALKVMAELAGLLGKYNNQAYWSAEETRVADAIRKHYFDHELGLFKDTPVSSKHHTGVNILAMELGLFREEERDAALNYLLDAPFETSVILSWNYLNFLLQNGRAQKAFELLTDPEKRWGRMIREGWKTTWEGFEDIESHSHAWNSYPLRLFQEYLLGIRCKAPGFKKADIRPFFPEGIDEMQGKVCTAKGIIAVSGRRDKNSASFLLEIPEGITANFSYKNVEKLLVGGKHSITVEF